MPHETRKKNTMTKIDGRCSLLPEERERVRFYGERPTILHIRYTLCFLFFFFSMMMMMMIRRRRRLLLDDYEYDDDLWKRLYARAWLEYV